MYNVWVLSSLSCYRPLHLSIIQENIPLTFYLVRLICGVRMNLDIANNMRQVCVLHSVLCVYYNVHVHSIFVLISIIYVCVYMYMYVFILCILTVSFDGVFYVW